MSFIVSPFEFIHCYSMLTLAWRRSAYIAEHNNRRIYNSSETILANTDTNIITVTTGHTEFIVYTNDPDISDPVRQIVNTYLALKEF